MRPTELQWLELKFLVRKQIARIKLQEYFINYWDELRR